MAPLMALYGIKLNLISPPALRMDEEHVNLLRQTGEVTVGEDLEAVLPTTDVLYATRVQKERFATEEDYLKVFF